MLKDISMKPGWGAQRGITLNITEEKRFHENSKCNVLKQNNWSFKSRKLTEKWTPLELQKSRSLSCLQEGWHSTWLTAGGTRATSSKSPNFLIEKLLTPIALALPESHSASIAFHVLAKLGCKRSSALAVNSAPIGPFFIATGQWIWKGRTNS